MVEAGILDGDTAIIRRGDTAENGEIVVALVDESEVDAEAPAPARRLDRAGSRPTPRYETRDLRADRVRVQGRLVGLLRKY